MNSLLSVRQLDVKIKIDKKSYSVINKLSFDLKAGTTLALVGESGCGKTMTALSILRILPSPPVLPPSGEILYKGTNLLKLSEKEMRLIRGKRIAMIFQDPMTALNPVYTIGYQLLEVAAFHLSLYNERGVAAAIKALEDVGMPNPEHVMKAYPHQVSGGMKQRAMIAMALICSPDILIADEPTTALDVSVQAQILDLMKDLQKKKGMSILLITHDMGVVAEIADEMIVMYAAQSVEKGTVYDIFDNKAHPYTQGLFASKSDRPLRNGKLTAIKGNVPPITAIPSGCPFHNRCPYVMDICKQGQVPNFALSEPTHSTKCWLYEDHPRSQEP